MSLQEEKNIIEEVKILSFSESLPLINDKYISLLNDLNEKFKYHDDLSGPLESDLNLTTEKLPSNKYQVIDIITDMVNEASGKTRQGLPKDFALAPIERWNKLFHGTDYELVLLQAFSPPANNFNKLMEFYDDVE